MPTPLQRYLDLIAFLVTRHFGATAEEIFAEVPGYARTWDPDDERAKAATHKAFDRDRKALRGLGFPIETVEAGARRDHVPVHVYRLRPSRFQLPYLRLLREADAEGMVSPAHRAAASSGHEATPTARSARTGDGTLAPRSRPTFELTPDEAHRAIEGLRRIRRLPDFPLRREAAVALGKLTFDLEGDAPAPDPILWATREPRGRTEALRELANAILRRREVHFHYHSIGRDDEAHRRVRPYGLLFQRGYWYLSAYDRDREALRLFRVDRMREIEARGRTGSFELPDDFDIRDYAGRRAWELGDEGEEPFRAEVRFAFPRSLWAERNGHGALVRDEPDGAHLRSFDLHEEGPFLRWLLTLGGDASIVSPPALADRFRALAAAVAALYEADDSGADDSRADDSEAPPDPGDESSSGEGKALPRPSEPADTAPPSPTRPKAPEILARLLHILPRASRDGGARVDELAADLDVPEHRIIEDLEEAANRVCYLPAGAPGASFSAAVIGGRVLVSHPLGLDRPLRLTPSEAICVVLGLRAFSGGSRDDPLRTRLERDLAALDRDEALPDERWEVADLAGPERLREELIRAARECARCRISYLKPDADEPEERRVHPWRVAWAEGRWYLLGRPEDADGPRLFRLDRILSMELDGQAAPPPSGVDPQDFFSEGRAFFTDGPIERSRVRYSPRIARWIVERHPDCDRDEDGSVVVTHEVADPAWLARHVLQYGTEAELLEPPAARALVRDAASRMAGVE